MCFDLHSYWVPLDSDTRHIPKIDGILDKEVNDLRHAAECFPVLRGGYEQPSGNTKRLRFHLSSHAMNIEMLVDSTSPMARIEEICGDVFWETKLKQDSRA